MINSGKIELTQGKIVGVYVGGEKLKDFHPLYNKGIVSIQVDQKDGTKGHIALKIMKKSCLCYHSVTIDFFVKDGFLYYK